MKTYLYKAFGLKIRTDFELFSVPSSNAIDGKELIVSKVHNNFVSPVLIDDDFCVKEVERGILYHLKDIATFLIGKNDTIEIYQICNDNDWVESVLMDGVMNTYLSSRRFFVFKGAALIKNNEVQLLMGISGVGISTIAAELNKKGFELLSDNKIIIQYHKNEILLIPAVNYSKLCIEDIERMDLKSKTKNAVRSQLSKYYVDLIPRKTNNNYIITKNAILTIKARGSYRLGSTAISGIPLIEYLGKLLYKNTVESGQENNKRTFEFLSDFTSSAQHVVLERPSAVYDVNKTLDLLSQ